MPQASSAHDTFWDFVSLMPESTHMLIWQMSDRAIPRSYRTMQGFGVHTFRLINAAGEVRFVKFHWNPVQGTHSLVWDERPSSSAPIPTTTAATCGKPSIPATSRSGNWDCKCSRKSRPLRSNSTSSTQPS